MGSGASIGYFLPKFVFLLVLIPVDRVGLPLFLKEFNGYIVWSFDLGARITSLLFYFKSIDLGRRSALNLGTYFLVLLPLEP